MLARYLNVELSKKQVDEEMRVMREQMRGWRERLDNTTESVVAREERNREAKRVLREKTREINRLHDERAKLLENEEKIVAELIDCQGPAVDIGGYWKPDHAKCTKAMLASPTLNKILGL